MPTLHAGEDDSGRHRIIKLTDSQFLALGFQDDERPTKLGCGVYACTYAPRASDSVVKITKDAQDALAAWILKNRTDKPNCMVPIYAVYRLAKNTYAICAAKASPLTEDWAGPIDIIYDYAEKDDVLASEWEQLHAKILKEIGYRVAEHGGMPTQDDRNMSRALNLVNECVLEFRKMGLDWEDFHDLNFMLYQGRPVVVDLGAAKADYALAETELPNVREIPILPF